MCQIIDHHQCSRCSATSMPFARALGKGCLYLCVAMVCGLIVDLLFVCILYCSPFGSGDNLRCIYKKPSRKLSPGKQLLNDEFILGPVVLSTW